MCVLHLSKGQGVSWKTWEGLDIVQWAKILSFSIAFIYFPSGKIYPSRDEYEAHQERVLARISKHNNQQALSHSIEEGLKIQAMTR